MVELKRTIHKVDRYFRKENTSLAEKFRSLSINDSKPGEPWTEEDATAYRNSATKNLLERIAALSLGTLSLPILLALSTLVLAEDGLPLFYVQGRETKYSGKVPVYKIRCMIRNADKIPGASTYDSHYKSFKDKRNLPLLGTFMRRFELEELPQLWQVVLGQLSLINIRAAPQYDFDENQALHPTSFADFDRIYRASLPGIVSLNSAVNPKRKINNRRIPFDLIYGKKASLGLDLYILWRLSLRALKLY